MRQLVDRRAGLLHPQALLRREQDQRRVPLGVHLAAQQVEVLRRRRGVADLDVVLGGRGEEALDAGRRVLRALALVAVRQQQHEAVALAPLVLGGDEVLVDDDLGAVDEVAELRLPQHERLGVAVGVAVLEAERGVLRQQRVVDPERALGARRGRRAGSTACRSRSRSSAAWRWLNVPRRESSPARRTLWPSSSSDPNASASAVAHSTSPSSYSLVRRVELAAQLGVDRERLGIVGQVVEDAVERRRGRRRSRCAAARRPASAAWPP